MRSAGGVSRQQDCFVHANVVDTAVLKESSQKRKTALTDVDLIEKEPKARVPLNLPSGAVYLRAYQEATGDGTVLQGYQNQRLGRSQMRQKYWVSPQSNSEPLQWYSLKSVLGHVRMKRVDGIGLCYDRIASDYNDLVEKYHAECQESGVQCSCAACKCR